MTVPLRTRVLIADDHAVVRRGLCMVLDAAPDLHVVAEAGDGIEAVDTALREDIDLAVLDVAMPRRTGLQAARELHRRRPEIRIVMLSMHDIEEYCFQALKAGASGYVLKTVADRDLVAACRAAMRGEAFLYPPTVRALSSPTSTTRRLASRTYARDWANDHRSTSAAVPMLSEAFRHGFRGTGASATPLKGTDATASGRVRGILRGQP